MTKSFQFRLEPLLKVRRLAEDAARRELALARKDAAEQDRKLRDLLDQEEEAGKSPGGRGGLDVVWLRTLQEYRASLEVRIRREHDRLQELVQAEAGKRRALAEAAKGVKVLERLRERQERRFRQELERQEQKFLDEVAGRRDSA